MTAARRPARIVVRCNAGGATGLGHLSRCLTLAEALDELGAQCLFVLPHEAEPVRHRIDARGHDSVLVDASTPRSDLAALEAVLADAPTDWLLIDHYDADGGDLAAAARLVRPGRLAVLDDTGARELGAADLVVNPSPNAEAWSTIGPTTTLLSGPGFALLAPAWREARGAFAVRVTVERVAIYLGGATTTALLTEACRAVHAQLAPTEIVAVAPDGVSADLAPSERDHVRLERHLAPAQMAALFASADVAVVTPSTIAWEVACIGVPSVFVQTVDNQHRVAAFLSRELDTVTRHGELDGLLARRSLATHEARRELSSRLERLTDGCGASRVASQMLSPVERAPRGA